MGLFDRAGGLFGGTPDPNAQAYQMPRLPWAQNDAVTAAAFGLLGGRTLNEGLQNAAQVVPAGLAANTAKRRDMYTIGQENARKAQMNEALKNWPGLSPEQKALFVNQPELFGQYAVSTMTPKEQWMSLTDPAQRLAAGIPATDMRPAQRSTATGEVKFPGGGGTNVQIDNVGSIPQGYELVTDPATGAKQMRVIPGGPAEVAERSADVVEQAGAESQAVKAETMLDATKSIKDEIASANLPAVGTNSRAFGWHSGTAAGRVRSYVGSLKSGVALQTILKLKEASSTGATGFGALSAPELQLLVDDIGSLDPDNTEPDIFLKTIDRIETRWQGILNDVERTVPPERLKEMGIDIEALRGGAEDGGSEVPAPTRYKNPTTGEVVEWNGSEWVRVP